MNSLTSVLALVGIGVALIVRLEVSASWLHDESERRFEFLALRRVGSLYAAYMVLLALWPWPWIPQPWRASLGFAHARDKNRPEALAALKEAERLDPEQINVQQKLALTYELLGEAPVALSHYEKLLKLARKRVFRDYTPEERETYKRLLQRNR